MNAWSEKKSFNPNQSFHLQMFDQVLIENIRLELFKSPFLTEFYSIKFDLRVEYFKNWSNMNSDVNENGPNFSSLWSNLYFPEIEFAEEFAFL